MRVLLDEHLPVDLALDLAGHDVDTVVERGWTGIKSSKWPTFAATARVFKLSAATRRRISREVEEFLEKHKDALAAANGRGTAVKSHRRVARKAAHRPAR